MFGIDRKKLESVFASYESELLAIERREAANVGEPVSVEQRLTLVEKKQDSFDRLLMGLKEALGL